MVNSKKEPKKFIEFYLTELLNHVKNTSEHRFQPAEFSAIKKILVYLLHSINPVEQIETLQRVPVLKSLYDFFNKVLKRFEDPAYRKSQMMASIEVDSEKLSRLFSDIFQSIEMRRDLTHQLPALGITLQYPLFKEEPAAIKEPEIPVETRLPSVKPAVMESPTQEFRRVGDMLGFLTRRVKKAVNRTTETPKTLTPTISEKPSSLSELKKTVRQNLREILKSLEQVQSNPKRTGYIIELADAIGSLKKTFRLHEAMPLYDIFRGIEKTLNDVADRVDEKVVSVHEPAQAALNHIFHTVLEWTDSPDAVTTEGLETAIRSSVKDYHSCLSPAPPKPKTPETIPSEEKEPIIQEIRIDPKQVDEGNFTIFRDETRYYLNSIDTILSHFEDTDSSLAVREIEQSIRAINTAARMLRLQYVADLCGAYIRSLEIIQRHSLPIPPEWIRQYQAAQLYFHDLLGIKPIPLGDWQKMLATLADTEKNIQQILSRAQIRETEPEETVVPELPNKEKPITVPATWMDAVQSVVMEFYNGGGKIIPPAVDTPKAVAVKPKEEKAPVPEITRTDDIILPDLKPVESDTVKIRPPSRERKEKTELPVTDDVDLLSLMVDPHSDLSKIRVPLFMERMNTEPQDIAEVSKGFVRKMIRENLRPAEQFIHQEKTRTPEIKETPRTERVYPEQLTTKLQRILLIESKFKEVDKELFEVFNQESESYFRLLDKALKKLQTNLRDDSAIRDIERASHSIKSSAKMLGFDKISGLAACLEIITERYFDKEIVFDETLHQLFGDIVATLRRLFGSESVDITSIAERLGGIEKQLSLPGLLTRYLVMDKYSETQQRLHEKTIEPVESKTKDTATTETRSVSSEQAGIEPEILDIFREEAESYFNLFDSAIQKLITGGNVSECYKDMEKAAYSLKSSSRMIGLHTIAELARQMEIISEKIAKNPQADSPEILPLFQDSVRTLKAITAGNPSNTEQLLGQLKTIENRVSQIPAMEEPKDSSALSVSEKAVPKTKIRKSKAKKQVIPFTDVDLQNDPILRHKLNQENNLLDEMAGISQEVNSN